jgi:hypothetical protein
MTGPLTSRIVKGGALLDDAGRLVDIWDARETPDQNLRRILVQNLLAKRSRIRLEEVLDLVLRPRFVEPGPHVIASLKLLRSSPTAFREACYYETARADPLIALFAEDALFPRHLDGRTVIQVAEVERWLAKQSGPSTWGDAVRRRVAQGLLATLRDFGVVEGAVNKRLAAANLSVAGFAYAAFREHEQGRPARALVASKIWQWWLLEEQQVRGLFDAAARHGFLRYAMAGSAVRIDWTVGSLEDLVRAAA